MSFDRRLNELSTLNAILEILNQEANFSDALQIALGKLVHLLSLSTGWVFLNQQADTKEHSLGLAASIGLPPALRRNKCSVLKEKSCDCHWLFRQNALDAGVNIVTCSRLASAKGDKGGLELHASVPLLSKEGAVGILNLAAPGKASFDEETLQFLTAVGRTLGLAFRRAKLQEQQAQEREAMATLEERARLAREMHDSVTQVLFAANLSLRVALESETQREASLQRSSDLVSSALSELRALIELLRPADLSQGLLPALARLAERVADSAKVHIEAGSEVPENLTKTLYRVAQEGVHNALKHAQAANIWITIEAKSNEIYLRIDDDGRGLSSEVKGLGIVSLQQRAALHGGHISLKNRKPSGARLEVSFPLLSPK